jgi:hypothetical protein
MPRQREGRTVIPSTIRRSDRRAQERKARRGPSDPQAARGLTTRPRTTDEPRAPTAGGKVVRTPSETRRKARQARREDVRGRRARTLSSSRRRRT